MNIHYGSVHVWESLVVFLLTFALLIAGDRAPRKLDRPTIALAGALMLLVSGVLRRSEAVQAIDWATISLLLGMMIIIHFATESGLIDHLTERLLSVQSGPEQLLGVVCVTSGVLSALFVNDTICLLMTPLLLTLTRRLRLPAEPFLLALATSSNVGSVMTLTGNPQNMLIGQSSGWTWGTFALRMIPIGAVCLALNATILILFYRRQLRSINGTDSTFTPNVTGTTTESIEIRKPLQPTLAGRTALVLVALLTVFLLGAPMDIATLSAATVLLIWANRRPEEAFRSVDWPLLLFFACLFVVVAGVTRTEGALISKWTLISAAHPDTLWGLLRFSLVSALGSNLFSNVPFVMLLRGAGIAHAPHANILWLALASSSTLAGNLTLIGSVANLIVAERAAREGVTLSFATFFRVGAVTTVLTILVSVLMLWFYQVVHWI